MWGLGLGWEEPEPAEDFSHPKNLSLGCLGLLWLPFSHVPLVFPKLLHIGPELCALIRTPFSPKSLVASFFCPCPRFLPIPLGWSQLSSSGIIPGKKSYFRPSHYCPVGGEGCLFLLSFCFLLVPYHLESVQPPPGSWLEIPRAVIWHQTKALRVEATLEPVLFSKAAVEWA